MQIEIVNVNIEKVRTWQVANVVYKGFNGENKTFKLVSFSNPATFAVLKDAQAGETYEVTTSKNDKDYTVWTSATKVATSNVATAAAVGKTAWVPDADRQRLIVKQSSLSNAVALIARDGRPPVVQEILDVADQFVAYVYDVQPLEVEQV